MGTRRIAKPTSERALPVYNVDEPVCMPADRVVAAVTAPPVEQGDLEALLRCLLPTTSVTTQPPRPMPTDMEILLKRLLSGMTARRRYRRHRMGLREWKPCYSGCSWEPRFQPRGRDRVPLDCVFLVWQTGLWGGQVPIYAVKVSAVLVNATPDPMDSPVPTGLAGADDDTNRMSPLTQQAVLEGDLSMKEEVVAELDFCESVVGGPTSAFLSSTDGIVDFAGDFTVVVSSPANVSGYVTVGVSSPSDLAGDVTVGVSSPADLAGDVTKWRSMRSVMF